MKLKLLMLALALSSAPAMAVSSTQYMQAQDSLLDYTLKRAMIQESIASYDGVCACPYSINRQGNECGATSAWSKPGGADPICYYDEISPLMLYNYKRSLFSR